MRRSHLRRFEDRLRERLSDIVVTDHNAAPLSATFFIGLLIGVIIARIACLCTKTSKHSPSMRKFKPEEKFGSAQ